MLKRTKGRLLLALLVMTGLAGTITTTVLSKKERKSAINLMKDTKTDFLKSVKDLSEAQLNFKSAPGRWSVKECAYHIAAAEKALWSMLEGTLKAPANPEKRTEIKVNDDQFVAMIENRAMKAQAPEAIQPQNTGYKSLDEALEDFKNQRSDHIKYAKTTTEDLRNHVVQMPFGSIDCYQLYLMIAAHSNRHTQQINEVKADPNFPKQ
jgi:hypothetical protein